MAKQTAGILVYRKQENNLQVFLVHPGGPFWKNKDAGAWSIPKGEFLADEEPLAAAKREFAEETGQTIDGDFIPLGQTRSKGGKDIHVWTIEGEVDETNVISNTFPFEWPPRSGKMIDIPEVDRGGWFGVDEARVKINQSQMIFIDRLMDVLH
ncbi:NUDIX domain-containing protein [Mucilaginibacter myungsuensis]|uniref:NUDIX domain-containing protein n=1 Tax=Mucilaginibacter myungsuensis TaxID=649104 RepID=A0A929PU26_9SPHI|nr:NUDIX domain-containing protein [Mucilaginibacter myungsuensis]MBE9660303.1 NUDIX domain-containing protein [Mucilaginibacter myungsuensis]MDN3600345.1 NUDIX domain-containing protein [Mucilaginibacter myungsuensis]